MLEQSVNGILTTLRRDGRPVARPTWYLALDRRIYIGARGKKLVLVEAGERWADLRAVHADGLVAVIEPDQALAARIDAAMAARYAAYRVPMPAATRERYARASWAMLAVVPQGKLLTGDNRPPGLG
jgi:hypothetical protein